MVNGGGLVLGHHVGYIPGRGREGVFKEVRRREGKEEGEEEREGERRGGRRCFRRDEEEGRRGSGREGEEEEGREEKGEVKWLDLQGNVALPWFLSIFPSRSLAGRREGRKIDGRGGNGTTS